MCLFSTNLFAQRAIIAPATLGPNALPIPEIKTGKLAKDFNLKIAYENHTSKGDDTQNAFIELSIPVVSNKVALVLSVVPAEYYTLDSETLEIRNITNGTASGNAGGDIYVGTHIQILKDKNSLPDILLSIDLKTASGTNTESARYTDAPGYIFDLSLGKDITTNTSVLESIRPFAMAGFYVYQTNRTDFRQNDAILYGAGVDLNFKKFSFTTSYGGYKGYIDDGDKPKVLRSTLRTRFNSIINYEIRLGRGFGSNFYDAVRLGLNINLNFINTLF
ncbi:hypothetical protein ULMA_06250 [Patiriisocius marinus]|uniref:MetA-pathway of phenol degradation n=2 Tax=Patiriisocius marinus TaxID=1397112 RepID=A0A5J4J1Y4_9FLAO|nr:hypothetical protein ULMA_06250 [Patiriisocius marinus]